MSKPKLYTQEEVAEALHRNLDNILQASFGHEEGENNMAKQLKQMVTLNGKHFWVTGTTVDNLLNNYMDLCIREGVVIPAERSSSVIFTEYLQSFVETFKSSQESLTIVNRDRMIKNHILPHFKSTPIDKITTTDIQKWFDSLSTRYSKETILKLKNIMSPCFDAAVEDGYIQRNPLRSTRLVIRGKETVHHKAIPADKMKAVRKGLTQLPRRELLMTALLAYSGMRFEEVLGLRWDDVDFDNKMIHISRAVVHPTRNQAEVKLPKTKTSTRCIPLFKDLADILKPYKDVGYILWSSKDSTHASPLSYTEARRSFNKIKDAFDLEGYTAHDFRDTCATEWREHGIEMDMIARMLGHSKTDITESRYVKYRTDLYDDVRIRIQG